MEPKLVTVKLSDLTLNPDHQGRAALNPEAIERYAAAIRAGKKRKGDPPRVYDDGTTRWLAGGWHWYYATEKAGKDGMECEVVPGTADDAFIFSLGDNTDHGEPRTPSDCWNVVLNSLRHPATRDLSRNKRQALCQVSNDTIDRVLKAWNSCPDKTNLNRETGLKILAELKAEQARASGQGAPAPAPDNKVRMAPADLVKVFGSPWFDEQLRFINGLLAEAENAVRKKDPLFAFFPIKSFRIAVQQYVDELLKAEPHCVCPKCFAALKVPGHGGEQDCDLCRADGKPAGFLPAGKWPFLTDELRAAAEGMVFGRGRYSGLKPAAPAV